MDNKQIEQELDDLEGRLERLRALYEQYFLGLEKLEPTVLRKDIDRKMWVMRREQIRNTGLRFKFQMLIQRYNTYQQYWTRIVREIENGTYRRDILKVAQRFGEKEALTILGKKRAEQYKRLAKNQLDRRGKRKGEAHEEPKPDDASAAPKVDEEIALEADDYELVEEADDEITPRKDLPPVRGAHDHGEPDMESLLMFATVGVKDWSAPKPEAPLPDPRSDPPKIEAPKAEVSRAEAPKSDVPKAPPAKADPPKAVAAASTAKSRVAELAAQMRAKKEAAKAKVDELDLDRLLDSAPGAALAPPRQPQPSKPSVPEPSKPIVSEPSKPIIPQAPKPPTFTPSQPSSAPSTPLPKPPSSAPSTPLPRPPSSASTTPLPRPAPSQQGSTSPFPRPASTTSLPHAQPSAPSAPKPSPAPAAASAKPSQTSESAPAKGDLSEQKMREIYAKYVGAKRAANESTAGITFDKLAQSLRAQAEKIRTSHPTRTIDFEVVTKDGKTALRPVVK